MDFDLEPAALVAELDAMRAARGLSYQQVASTLQWVETVVL